MAGVGIDDGFPANKLFRQGYSYTYDDVIFLPHYIDFPTDSVNLHANLSRNLSLSTPCVASPMDTVSEAPMAIAMAALGGISIVHSNNSSSEQAAIVRSAKSRRIPSATDLVIKSPSDIIDSVQEFASSPCILVTKSGTRKSELLGFVTRSDWESLGNKEATVSE